MKELLMQRLGCKERVAATIAEDLESLDASLASTLKAWVEEKEYDGTISREGYSLNGLMKDFHMSFIGALLTLDSLIKNPQEAIKALKYGIR